jgi:hypothetical protein
MAAAAPFVKLLRQLSAARDDYRTGAVDIAWDGGKASLFLVFGQPNHAVLDTSDGKHLEGQEALTGLVGQIPRKFQISTWRKEVVRTETLHCTLDDLMEPFAQLAGSASPSPAELDGSAAVEEAIEVDFGLDDFPLLPLGTTLWADAAANVVHLDVLVPSLPDALVVLTGSRVRAAGIVSHQRMVDAVWVDDEGRSSGEQAIMAMMAASQGSISGYRLEAPGLAAALPMLWRFPVAHRGLPLGWLDAMSFVEDLERQRRDCAISVTGPGVRGVALWVGGDPLAVYSDKEREPAASRERFLDMLRAPGARLTMRQQQASERVAQLSEASFHAFVPPAPEPVAAAIPETGDSILASAVAPSASPAAAAGAEPSPAASPRQEPGETGAPLDEQEQPRGGVFSLDRLAASAAAVSEEDGVPGWLASSPVPSAGETTPLQPAVWQEDAEATRAAVYDAGEAAPLPSPGDEERAEWDADGLAGTGEFDGVKKDLIQIVSLWLGGESALSASAMIQRTRPTVGDIMTTIDAIATLPLPGHEPSVVQAMAREMRFHAAEYLSGV